METQKIKNNLNFGGVINLLFFFFLLEVNILLYDFNYLLLLLLLLLLLIFVQYCVLNLHSLLKNPTILQ